MFPYFWTHFSWITYHLYYGIIIVCGDYCSLILWVILAHECTSPRLIQRYYITSGPHPGTRNRKYKTTSVIFVKTSFPNHYLNNIFHNLISFVFTQCGEQCVIVCNIPKNKQTNKQTTHYKKPRLVEQGSYRTKII